MILIANQPVSWSALNRKRKIEDQRLLHFDAAPGSDAARSFLALIGFGLAAIWVVAFIVSARSDRNLALGYGLHPYAYYMHGKFLVPFQLMMYPLWHQGRGHLIVDLLLLFGVIVLYRYFSSPPLFVRAYALGQLGGGVSFLLLSAIDGQTQREVLDNLMLVGAQPALSSVWWAFIGLYSTVWMMGRVGRGYTLLAIALLILVITGIVPGGTSGLLVLAMGSLPLVCAGPTIPVAALLKTKQEEESTGREWSNLPLALLLFFEMPICWAFLVFSTMNKDQLVFQHLAREPLLGQSSGEWLAVNLFVGPVVGMTYGVIEGLRQRVRLVDK